MEIAFQHEPRRGAPTPQKAEERSKIGGGEGLIAPDGRSGRGRTAGRGGRCAQRYTH